LPAHNFERPRGRIVELTIDSPALRDNLLGDPSVRTVAVYLPEGYETSDADYPVVVDLAGFTGSGLRRLAWQSFGESVPQRLDRLRGEGRMGPVVAVFPDCFTSLGGNQYVNSSAIGAYADYLTRELVPFVDRELRTLADRAHRGCFGKSSGGYGALIHGMKYPGCWGAIASHSGDCYFDFVYAPDWPGTLDELAKYRRPRQKPGKRAMVSAPPTANAGIDDGRIARFLEHVWTTEHPREAEAMALMLLAMAATYDPDPRAPNGFRVPYDLETGALLPQRWRRWLRHDPVNLVARYARNLRALRGIFIDCGWRDQYRMHYGNRLLSQRLAKHRVPHVYEEFDGTHSGIDYRMDRSLPFLYRALR
jgi:enterochelin esterase-like enzyme